MQHVYKCTECYSLCSFMCECSADQQNSNGHTHTCMHGHAQSLLNKPLSGQHTHTQLANSSFCLLWIVFRGGWGDPWGACPEGTLSEGSISEDRGVGHQIGRESSFLVSLLLPVLSCEDPHCFLERKTHWLLITSVWPEQLLLNW